jgi:hypothetical protein
LLSRSEAEMVIVHLIPGKRKSFEFVQPDAASRQEYYGDGASESYHTDGHGQHIQKIQRTTGSYRDS